MCCARTAVLYGGRREGSHDGFPAVIQAKSDFARMRAFQLPGRSRGGRNQLPGRSRDGPRAVQDAKEAPRAFQGAQKTL